MIFKDISNTVVFLSILFISQATILTNSLYINTIAFCLYTIVLFRNLKSNYYIYILLVIWVFINLMASFYLDKDISFIKMISFFIQICFLPYVILTIVGESFWIRFEKIVYKLTLLSLPLFALNILFPNFFNKLTPLFRYITRDHFYMHDTLGNYWSSLFYVNAIIDGDYYRNSGFMWEPGAFAMIIMWALIYHSLTVKERNTKKILVYSLAMFTTLSTAGFVAIFIFYTAFLLKNRISLSGLLLVVIVNSIFFYYIVNLDFVGAEISKYLESYDSGYISYSETYNAYKVNRFEIFVFELEKVLKYPFGYGITESIEESKTEKIIGNNGISNLMVLWGAPLFFLFIYFLWKYHELINASKISKRIIGFMLMSLLVMFFSNPISRNIFSYLIVFTVIDRKFNKNILV